MVATNRVSVAHGTSNWMVDGDGEERTTVVSDTEGLSQLAFTTQTRPTGQIKAKLCRSCSHR